MITTQSKDGPGNVLINIVNNLDYTKFRPIIAHLYYKEDSKENINDFVNPEVKIINLNMKSILKGWLDISVVTRINDVIISNNIDILHLHLHRPIIFGFLADKRIPKICTIHNQEPHQTPSSLFEKVVHYLEYFALWHSDCVTTVSNGVKDSILSCYKRINQKKVCTIYNGIAAFTYDGAKSNLRKSYNINTEDVVIASIGRLEEQKGIDTLIQAVSLIVKTNRVDSFKVFIIGEGHLESKLKEKVAENKLEKYFIFTGYLKNINSVLEEIDIIVMPSNFEGLGLALIEGMAHRKCCIGSRVGGIVEVLGDERLLVMPKDCIGLAEILTKAILDSSFRINIGEILYERYQLLFTVNKMVENYQELYIKTLENKI